MINKIISAISKALFEAFGTEYTIYKESIEQGLKEPCFFIQSLNPNSTPTITRRTWHNFQFMIQYFPKSNKAYKEINDVIEAMDEVLAAIEVDGCKIRAEVQGRQTVDKVLNYEVNYNFFMIDDRVEEPIEEYDISSEVRADD